VRGLLNDERGVALLDMIVACALIAMLAVATASAFAAHPNRSHAAAVALEAALAEARGLAAASADATDVAYPTGATVIVEPDPARAGNTRIAVYRSRPVVIAKKTPYPPPLDNGFPPQSVAGTFTFSGTTVANGVTTASRITPRFAIMLSGGGYASIVPLTAAYNATTPQTYTNDPGCAADGAQISVTADGTTEAHPFGCTGGAYAAN
jgi:hypothetical protein